MTWGPFCPVSHKATGKEGPQPLARVLVGFCYVVFCYVVGDNRQPQVSVAGHKVDFWSCFMSPRASWASASCVVFVQLPYIMSPWGHGSRFTQGGPSLHLWFVVPA